MKVRKATSALALIATVLGAAVTTSAGPNGPNGPMSNEPSHISSPYWNRTRSEFPSAEQTAAQLVAETPQAYADAPHLQRLFLRRFDGREELGLVHVRAVVRPATLQLVHHPPLVEVPFA